MTPLRVFRFFAVVEALTWLGLLAGMVVKYVPQAPFQGEAGVQVMGPIHGVAFIAYCLVTVLVSIDQGWSRGRTLLGLCSTGTPSGAARSTTAGTRPRTARPPRSVRCAGSSAIGRSPGCPSWPRSRRSPGSR